MKSQGEIEAAICDGIAKFQQQFLGRGPRDIHAHLMGTLLVVRLQGVLTPAERQLVAPLMPSGESASGDSGDETNGHGDGHRNGNGNGHGNGHENGNGHANGNGRALLKQMRAHMVSAVRPRLAEIVEMAAGVKLLSVHHDISTITGEELLAFSLSEPPACRQRKKP